MIAQASPGWVPLSSASSGAAFAGVLAAIVITISIQISTRSGSDARLSLKASPPTLVVLMVAAYLYIVLDGIPNSLQEVSEVVGSVDPVHLKSASQNYADIASRGFALSGSVLALGALMTLFIVAASVFDFRTDHTTDPDEGAEVWALAVFRAAVFTIVAILLLGFMVGAQIDGSGTPWWWWVLHILVSAGPAALVAEEGLRGKSVELARVLASAHRSPTLAVLLIAAAPAVGALALISTDIYRLLPLVLVSVLSAAYFGLCSALLLSKLEALREARGIPVRRTSGRPDGHDEGLDPRADVSDSGVCAGNVISATEESG